MRSLITAAIVALGLLARPAHGSHMWTTLIDTAPRAVFDQIGDASPRSAEGRDEGVGELNPGFERLGAP